MSVITLASAKSILEAGKVPTEAQFADIMDSNHNNEGLVTSTGSTTARTAAERFADVINVRDFGATADGTTDDAAAIQAALDAAGTAQFIKVVAYGKFRCASGIRVPDGVTFEGAGSLADNDERGTVLLFDLSVATCVSLSTVSPVNPRAVTLRGMSIRRAAGTIPASSIGVHSDNSYITTVSDVQIWRHDDGLVVEGGPGLSFWGDHIYTGVIQANHVVVDKLAGVRFDQCRFGSNGANDIACTSYVKITSSDGTTAADTVYFVNCQMNQGGGLTPDAAILFEAHPTGTSNTIFGFIGCYFEAFDNFLKSDATTPAIERLFISSCNINGGTVPLFALNAATQPNSWFISNNQISMASSTLAPTDPVKDVILVGNRFTSGLTINSAATGRLIVANNVFVSNLTLDGSSNWESLSVNGNLFPSGTLTLNNLGGMFSVDQTDFFFSWTPALEFGGAAVGMTYTNQLGSGQIKDNVVFASFRITLSAKGSSTGAAAITGLPFTVRNNADATGGGAFLPQASAMTGLTGALSAQTPANGTSVNLRQSAATGNTGITDAEFTNTSNLGGTLIYLR